MRPATLPTRAAFLDRAAHGTRIKYVSGCHCEDCRRANRLYMAKRTRAQIWGDWNGLVPAGKAQRHLRVLSRNGVGRRSVSLAGDIAESTIWKIYTGARSQIRKRTERKILGVKTYHRADYSLVEAAPTWRKIKTLLVEGYTKRQLAEALGYKNRTLQFPKARITARNALRVERLWHKYLR
jgi:hypothetical protein